MKLKNNWLAVLVASVMSASLCLSVTPADAATRTKVVAKSSTKSKGHVKARARVAVVSKKKSGAVTVRRTVARAHSGHAVPLASAKLPEFVPVEVNAPALAEGKVATVPSNAVAAESKASGASYGQLYGLHRTSDPLALQSSAALVLDQDTKQVLFAKNSEAVLPIASLTKLMTATVILDAKLPMDEELTVTADDVDTLKNSSSRLAVGTRLTRGELLHLALMASENRAAHALGRTYPGGLDAFVNAMNAKAKALGMADTRYVDPTGLNSRNQSSARDLALLINSAYQQPMIRELSTSHEYTAKVGSRQIQFHNTNSLVRSPSWEIGLQKTGYIIEAGRCLVMQAKMAGRKFIMVFLDSTGKYSRQADAERVRRWIEMASKHNVLSSLYGPKITS